MSLFSQIGMLGIGISGVLFGLALSYIAPEELSAGKKYFIILKNFLYVIFGLVTLYFVWSLKNNLLAVSILILLIFGSLLRWKFPELKFEFIAYLVFIFTFILLGVLFPVENYAVISSSIIFLYGLPLGTLLRTK
ncbi:MAG: hypothetical protein V2A62_00940 [Candidatus Woesearchaeota archaeon]